MHLASQDICPARRSVATEVIKGLGEYFNVSVGPQLLYGMEKLQYKEVNVFYFPSRCLLYLCTI